MRARLVALTFVLGMVAVAAAVAGVNQNWSTHANGAREIPARDTTAQAQAIFHLSEDGTQLEFKLIASNIENVTQAHIHQVQANGVGPIVLWLYPNATGPALLGPQDRTDGVLASGTRTAANLVGPLTGQPLSALIAAMNNGTAYVNVHTNDGVAPPDTGPGDFPGGEVRGDLR
jgi:hypothetical protein